MKINWKLGSWLLLLLAALLLVACGSGGDEPAADGDTSADTATEDTSEDTAVSTEKMTLILIENSWSASELNVAVAKNLLENELGYTVEVISLDENAQWPALAAGDAHASLEVWPLATPPTSLSTLTALAAWKMAGCSARWGGLAGTCPATC